MPQVSLEGTTLTTSGERRSEREQRDNGRRLSEVRYGRFERSLTVPDGIDPEKVTARYENGVLEAPYRCPRAMPPAGSRSRSRATGARRRPEACPGAGPPADRTAPRGRARDCVLV